MPQSNPLTLIRVLWKRRAIERSGRWTRSQLERHQLARLGILRRAAYGRSSFYRRFHRGLETAPLAKLPILTKAIMMENFDDLVTDRSVRLADVEAYLSAEPGLLLFRDRYVALATSGSTGRRGVFLFDKSEWLRALANIARPMAWAGLTTNPLHPPRTAMLASTTPWHYSSRVGLSFSNRIIPTLRLDAAQPMESMVRRLNEWQPEMLAVYPSVLRQLAAEQLAGRLNIPLRHIATSAEVLTAETRLLADQAWQIRVYDTYGATEYAPIAAECAYGRKHLVEDGAIIEIADRHGPVPPGVTGDRVLLTVFDRFTQPLIRYEISDMVRSIPGECECGRPFRLVDAIEGRFEDVLHFPARDAPEKTIAVHPNSFHRLLEPVPAVGWQVVQESSALYVYLAGLHDAALCRSIQCDVQNLLRSEGAYTASVNVVAVPELRRGPTGKVPLIVSHANQTQVHGAAAVE